MITKLIPLAARYLFNVALIYFVYTETGVFTAIFAILVSITFELQNFIIKKIPEKSVPYCLECRAMTEEEAITRCTGCRTWGHVK